MTDIYINALVSNRRPSLLKALPKIGIGAAIAASFKAIGQALDMAYVAPFSAPQPKHPIALDADLEGRDPKW